MLLNRFIIASSEHCDLRIFHCHHYNEIMIDENPIEFGHSLICQEAYQENYFTCDNCNEVEHRDYRNMANDSENEYCEGCYDDLTDYCNDCDYTYHSNRSCECNEGGSNLDDYNTRNPLHYLGKLLLRERYSQAQGDNYERRWRRLRRRRRRSARFRASS